MRKAWLLNILLLLLSLITAGAVGEVVMRVFFKDSIFLYPRYHSPATYGDFTIRRLRPDMTFQHTSVDGRWEFRINHQGFRADRDFSYDKLPGVLRVLVLGDSHTLGFEADQEAIFASVIERYLIGEGVGTEVINAGVSGFSTAEELVFLENEGIRYRPDVVVLGFYANDFEDNIKAGLFRLDGDQLVVDKYRHVPGERVLRIVNNVGILRWLGEHSWLYSYLMNKAWVIAKSMLLSKTQAELETAYAIPVGQVDEYQIALMRALLQRMARFCHENNARFIVLDIPQIMKNNSIRPSIPRELLDEIVSISDHFIYSKDVLDQYRNVTMLHVPHGHRHISELTHLVYGLNAAEWIRANLDEY